MSSAPNSPTVRYERVEMTQQVQAASSAPNTQSFAVTYRVEWQSDGRWLVGADGEGG